MHIRISDFGGIAPIYDDTKLPAPFGKTATDCDFEGGNVVPMFVDTDPGIGYPFLGDDITSLYRLSDRQWIAFTGDVAIVRAPAPMDADYLSFGEDYLIFYAGETGDSPTWPRFTSKWRAMGNADPASFFERPVISYPLGVPPPQSVPTVAASAAPSGSISTMKKLNPIEVICTAPHGLSNGDRVQILGMPVTGDGSELNGAQFAITVLGTSSFKLDSADGTAWEFDLTVSATWRRVYADSELEDRIYVYTCVNEFGQEGAPTGASAIVSVGEGQSVTVTMDTSASITVGSSPAFTVTHKRIYRSVSGSTSAEYFFVAEVPVAQPTYTDSLDTAALAETLSTANYDLPPAELKGLVAHPNGFLVGFVDNRIYCTEPFAMYAWPADYMKVIPRKIIGLAIYGTTIVAVTDGEPYMAQATDPGSLSFRAGPRPYPGTYRQAIVSTGSSVVYVSPLGLIAFDQAGAQELTKHYYSVKQWKDGLGTNKRLQLAFQDGKIWLNVERLGIACFDRREDNRLDITAHSLLCSAIYADRDSDAMFVMKSDGTPGGRQLRQYPGSTASPALFEWTSMRYRFPREINFGWMQVFASGYPVFVLLTSYNGSQSQLVTVTSRNPVRLASGVLSDEFEVTINATREVAAVHIAESAEELRQLAT